MWWAGLDVDRVSRWARSIRPESVAFLRRVDLQSNRPVSNARLTTVAFAVIGLGLLPTDPARAHTIPAVLELLVETDDRALVQMSHGVVGAERRGSALCVSRALGRTRAAGHRRR